MFLKYGLQHQFLEKLHLNPISHNKKTYIKKRYSKNIFSGQIKQTKKLKQCGFFLPDSDAQTQNPKPNLQGTNRHHHRSTARDLLVSFAVASWKKMGKSSSLSPQTAKLGLFSLHSSLHQPSLSLSPLFSVVLLKSQVNTQLCFLLSLSLTLWCVCVFVCV